MMGPPMDNAKSWCSPPLHTVEDACWRFDGRAVALVKGGLHQVHHRAQENASFAHASQFRIEVRVEL
jgi:hypothetical protein